MVIVIKKMNYWLYFILIIIKAKNTLVNATESDEIPISKEKKQLIIDTDAGSDDAVALLNVLSAEELFREVEVKLITAVHGNTHVDNVGRNILKTLKTIQRLDIPLYKGANESLLITPQNQYYFGKDGFGDFDYPDPPSEDLIKKQNAVLALIEAVTSHPGELTLICLGPLTNIAMAIKMYPKFLDNLKDVFVLGGSDSGVGNVKPGVEFNIYTDPEAAFIVFKDAEKKRKLLNVVSWESALRSQIEMNWRKNILGAMKSPQVNLINNAERLTLTGSHWVSADTILSAIILDPHIVESEHEFHIDVEVYGNFARGAFFINHKDDDKQNKNARIIKMINSERYKNMLLINFNSRQGLTNGASRNF